MKVTAPKPIAFPTLTAIVENPFFDQKYGQHVLFYSQTEDQLPKIVKTTSSYVLPRNPVLV